VHRSDDRRLERTVGSAAGLRMIFTGMARRFRPDRARGFSGDIQYELRGSDGRARRWVLSVDGQRARARPGGSSDPRLTVSMDLADFARMAGRDLDPFGAVMDGRMRIDGDFQAATRLGEMFDQPSAV
jgi:putative sterol carrier protein